MKVVGFDEQKSKNGGKPMLKLTVELAASGEHKGKRLVDYFVIDGATKFPMQRLHAMLLAAGFVVKTAKLAIDLDQVSGKAMRIETKDEVQQATEQYAERTNSRIVAYHTLKPTAAAPVQEAASAAPTSAPEPEPEATEVVEAPEAGKPAAEAEDVADVGAPSEVEDIDDLFK